MVSIDPKLQYCQCGYTFVPGTVMKMRMLLFGECSWRCPQCHSVLKFRLISHVVKVDTVSIKNRSEVWKNG